MKTNIKPIRLFVVASFLLCPLISICQNNQLTVPLELKMDDYLPLNNKSIKTSPAYTFTSHASSRTLNSSIFTNQVNINSSGMNIIGDAANEPSIAFNPLNSNQIAIGWRQFDNIISNFRQAGWSYTNDGGQSWIFPGVIEPGIFRSDPVLDYDTSGNFYYNSLTVDSANNFSCDVFKSTNGGATWNTGSYAYGGDKQWMAIDRTSGIGSGNIYSNWVSFYTACPPDFFTRSTNGGISYESCTSINGEPYWGTMVVGNTGNLFVCGNKLGSDSMQVVKTVNAQIPGSNIVWDPSVSVFMDGFVISGANVNPGGLIGQADIDVDRSSVSGPDVVYLLSSVFRISNYDPADIMFAKSLDGGLSWSAPLRINDDISATNSQWFGTMSVAPNGRIDAIWLDTRDAPFGSDSSALYYSYSTDQGTTWSANEKLSDLFDPHIGYPNQNKMGDYFDMISEDNGAHLAWANTLNGGQDVYYSYIVPPTVSGLDDAIQHELISISPNPTSDFLTLTGNHLSEFTIYNALGQTVFNFDEPSNQNGSVTVNISHFPDGIYYVRIGNTTKKISKTKSNN